MALRDRLSRNGVDCHFFYKARYPTSLFTEDQIAINPEREGDGSLGDSGWLQEKVWPVLEKYEHAILHTHSYNPPFKFRPLLRRHGRTTWVATIHRCPMLKVSRPIRVFKQILRAEKFLPEWYVGVSDATRRYIENSFGKSKVLTIHNGIVLPDIADCERVSAGPCSQVKRFLFVNRLDRGKGVELLLNALSLILRFDPDFHLTIVGDGPFRNLVDKFLRETPAPNVTWFGHTDDVGRFYASHDVLLLPYTRPQGLSLVSLEGRAYGLPAIYTPLGGVAETRNESNGVAMDEVSAESLVRAITRIQSDNDFPDLVKGCFPGLEYFSLQRMVADYCNLYQRLFSLQG